MKITFFDIKGFGKFNQVKITPGAGFNMIYAENEAGKSTLQTFIRAMLYGQKGGRKFKDGSLPPLKQYKPWNAEQYAGVMEYTLDNGDFYRVGRNFDKGTSNIYDKGANNVGSSFTQDSGGPRFAEEHLGIDEATFERSVFIQQSQSAFDDDGKKILAEKLSNLSSTGSEELSLTKAINVLDTELLEKVGTGRSTTRPLDRINARISELEQNKKSLMDLNERYLDTAVSLHEKRNLLAELTRSLEQKKLQKEAMRYKKLKSLYGELEALSKESEEVESGLSGCRQNVQELEKFGNITDNTLSKAFMLLHDQEHEKESIETETARLANLREKCDALKETLEEDEVFKNRTQDVESALEDYKKSKEAASQSSRAYARGNTPAKSSWSKTFIFILMFAALVLMGYYIINPSPVFLGIGILIIAAFGIVWSYISMKKTYRNAHPHTDADELNQALNRAGFNDMTDYIKYRESQLRDRGFFESTIREAAETQTRLNLMREKSETRSGELKRILADFISPDQINKSAVELLKQDFGRFANAKETEKNLLSRRAIIIDKNNILLREAGTITGKSFKSLNDFKAEFSGLPEINKTILPDDDAEGVSFDIDLEETQKRIERVKLEITALDTRMEQVPSEGELVKVMEELALLKDKKDKYELAGSSLILARQVLNDAAAKLQQDYVPALNNEISKMMSLMTSGRYEIIRTNDKLQINLEVPETDELISVSRLSGGTIDQVYFCMRIAAVLILERNREILPLFLDEPFSQYDENRVLKAFQLLKEISEKHQVFFFTCRARESELAKAVFGENMSLIHF